MFVLGTRVFQQKKMDAIYSIPKYNYPFFPKLFGTLSTRPLVNSSISQLVTFLINSSPYFRQLVLSQVNSSSTFFKVIHVYIYMYDRYDLISGRRRENYVNKDILLCFSYEFLLDFLP